RLSVDTALTVIIAPGPSLNPSLLVRIAEYWHRTCAGHHSSCALRSDDTEARQCQGEQATARERPQAGSCRPAMMDVINLAGELRHAIETGNQIPAGLALQRDETKDETPLEQRFGRRHEDRRQVWWLSPDDRDRLGCALIYYPLHPLPRRE